MGAVCLFDDVASGHHPRFTAELVRGTLLRGRRCLVACPDLEEELAVRPDVVWLRVAAGALRKPAGGHRMLRKALLACRRQSVEAFWDLYLDKNVWALPRGLKTVEVRVHVLHAVNQYQYQDRDTIGKLRTAFLRRRLETLTSDGAVIVVHTRHAFDVLAGFLPTGRLLHVGYPVETPDPIPDRRMDGDLRLLFVGEARRQKGLFELLEAMEMLRQDIGLDVVGPQPPGLRDLVTTKHPTLDIRWIDRFVTDTELRQAFHHNHLVALPYQTVFRVRGGASGVLLQALSEGVPLVTTPSLAGQLPDGYGGALVAASDTAEALADALTRAVDQISELATSAAIEGPAFVKAFHTFDRYVDALLRIDGTGPMTPSWNAP